MGIRAVNLEMDECDRIELWKELRQMVNKVLEDVKASYESHNAILKKVKALAESNKAMNEELSRLQEGLENMIEEVFTNTIYTLITHKSKGDYSERKH